MRKIENSIYTLFKPFNFQWLLLPYSLSLQFKPYMKIVIYFTLTTYAYEYCS